MPSFVDNHGVQSSSGSFHSYLSSCTLLLGMGDPILGPTVFQAMAAGVVYVNYQYVATQEVLDERPHARSKASTTKRCR